MAGIFLKLATSVLQKADRPLAPTDIWKLVQARLICSTHNSLFTVIPAGVSGNPVRLSRWLPMP